MSAAAGWRRAAAVSPGSSAPGCPYRPAASKTHTVPRRSVSKALAVSMALSLAGLGMDQAFGGTTKGVASWYGEEHRGKLMANGKRFNPENSPLLPGSIRWAPRSWSRSTSASQPRRSVVVTITDRGPTSELVRDGRIIDLSHAPFRRLAHPDLGLVAVAVQPLR